MKLKAVVQKFQQEYEIDPTKVNVFSRDLMRIDVGLII